MDATDAGGPLLFLSHAGADTAAARRLKQRLEDAPEARAAGLRVWFDKNDLRPGAPWMAQLEEAIERRATAFAVYVGSRGVVNWVEAEVRLALSRATGGDGRFPFVPVIAAASEGSAALPGFARQFQGAIDVENRPEEFRKLLAAVLGRGDGESGLTAEAEPFFGLRAIDEERSHLFFGRKAETEELVRRLRDQRLLLVVGDSGSGKSSLVKAGLVPRWRGGALSELDGRRPDEEVWHVLELRPGRDPKLALGDAVFKAAGALGRAAEDRGTYMKWATGDDPELRRQGLRCGLDSTHTRTLVVVDQLEELVTLTPKERRGPFVQLLLGLADPEDEAFSVALTMRRDYYNLLSAAECRPLYDRLEARDRAALYRLGRMTDDGLRRIVTEPLQLAGIKRQEGEELAHTVLRDVGERPGDLALVQFALTRAWERRAEFGGSLVRAYAGVGRVDGALAGEAERVFERVLGGEANAAEVAATLIRLARLEGTAGPTRRVARRREFPDGRWALLQTLADVKGNRLVLIGGRLQDSGVGGVADPDAAEETAEIAHEALLTCWPRLHTWLADASDHKRTLDRLTNRGAEWADAATPEARERLLARTDAEREDFDALMHARPLWLSAEEQAFVEASVADHAVRLRREQEARERERRQRRRALIGAVFATVLAIVATVLAIVAVDALAKADRARLVAIANESRALVALSEAASMNGRHTDALKLAILSWPRLAEDPRRPLASSLHAMGLASAGRIEIVPPLRHEGTVVFAVFSPDGRRVVTASVDRTARLWDAVSGTPLGPPLRHEGAVQSAAFSPDGARVVTTSWDGTARLWNAADGAPFRPPLRHEGTVWYAAFSRDGARVVTASADGTARLWDAASGAPLHPPLRHDGVVQSAAFSPDGTRVVTASADHTARLWNASDGAPLGPPLRHEAAVQSAAFSGDGARVVTASADRTARLWNVASGAPLGPPLRHEGGVLSAAFSPDGARVVTASADRTARLWDAASGAPLGPPLRHVEVVRSAAFSPDGARVVTASWDRTARLWDAASGDPLGLPLRHERPVTSAEFSPDGARVVTASDDGTARLWEAARSAPLGPPLRHEGMVWSAAFGPDGARVVTASADGTARLWDAASGAPLSPPLRHDGQVEAAMFSQDGVRVVTASADGTARLWDAASGAPLGAPLRHAGMVQSAAFSQDGARVVTASADGTARLWDAASGAPFGPPLRHEAAVQFAAFSPDGARVVTASADGTARLWDAASGAPFGPPLRHAKAVQFAAFSPDGARVVTASDDRTARLWDSASGNPLGPPLQRHEGPVRSAAFSSPDGARVVTASADGTARLWDAISGAPLGPPMRHDGSLRSAAFSPDGARVVTASVDGNAQLWDAASGAPLGSPLRHKGEVLSAAFSPDGARVVTASADGTARLWNTEWPQGPVTMIACALLGKDVAQLADRYGISIRDPICGPDMPKPDLHNVDLQ